jgi:hypothetical protein
MVVEVGPEIEQLVLEIRRSPEQNLIQILPSNGAVLWRSPLCGVRARASNSEQLRYLNEHDITDRRSEAL